MQSSQHECSGMACCLIATVVPRVASAVLFLEAACFGLVDAHCEPGQRHCWTPPSLSHPPSPALNLLALQAVHFICQAPKSATRAPLFPSNPPAVKTACL